MADPEVTERSSREWEISSSSLFASLYLPAEFGVCNLPSIGFRVEAKAMHGDWEVNIGCKKCVVFSCQLFCIVVELDDAVGN